MTVTEPGAMTQTELIAEIELLRARLGEPPRGEAAVSWRNVQAILQLTARMGLRPAELAEGLPLDLEAERAADAWITWDEFNALIERVRELRGDAGAERLGRLALDSTLFDAMGLVAGAFVGERELIDWVATTVFRDDGLYFRGVDCRAREVGPATVQVRWDARGAAWFSPAFGLLMAATTGELPRLVRAGPASVALVRSDLRCVEVRVALSDRRVPPLARVRRAFSRRRRTDELRALYTQMVETNQRLSEKLAALERSHRERRSLAQKLETRRRSEILGRFASNLRHQLNNQLTVILSRASALAMSAPERRTRDDLEVVVTMAERAARLVRQLHALDRDEPTPSEPVDLDRLVEGAHDLLARVGGPDVEVVHRRGGGPATAVVDPARAEQVLVNLVLNAREAMPGGGRVTLETVRITVGEDDAKRGGLAPGVYVGFDVRDDGDGMDDATRARVFEPFFTTKESGHGVGLATVRAAVRSQGGDVFAESTPGHGSTFRVRWPLADGPARPEAATTPAGASSTVGRRLLLIEDNDAVREATRQILGHGGYVVTSAPSGDAALELIGAGLRPEVIVSDVIMPGIRGAELAAALRDALGPVPLLFVSGYADRALDADLGPRTDYLPKPYRPAELLDRIAALLAG